MIMLKQLCVQVRSLWGKKRKNTENKILDPPLRKTIRGYFDTQQYNNCRVGLRTLRTPKGDNPLRLTTKGLTPWGLNPLGVNPPWGLTPEEGNPLGPY